MNHLHQMKWAKGATFALVLAVAGVIAFGGLTAGLQADHHESSFAADFGPDWKLKAANALEMAEAMPADKWDFKPTEEMRSFGELMHHIASSNFFFAAKAAGADMPEAAKFEGEKTKEAVLTYMKTSFATAGELVATIDDGKKEEVIDLFGGIRTQRRKVALFMLDHVTHHLGYAGPYIRLSGGKEVPAYRFTGSDQSPM